MPTKPGRLCSYPICPKISTRNGYCEDHQPYRDSPSKRGYTVAWRKAAKAFLDEYPLCAECERNGRLTPAREVDHIIPHKGDYDLFWDRNNWQSLCTPCHSWKTLNENPIR